MVPFSGQRVRYVNLDYAASAPALRPVADLVRRVLPLYASGAPGSRGMPPDLTAAYEAARGDVAAFLGAGGDDVTVFTRNTTDALNLLARVVPGPVASWTSSRPRQPAAAGATVGGARPAHPHAGHWRR